MLVVSPLVKGRRGLIIFETLQNGTIDHDLERKKNHEFRAGGSGGAGGLIPSSPLPPFFQE